MGVTYKANIADQRESPAVEVAKLLIAKGADVRFHDPLVKSWKIDAGTLAREEDLDGALAADVAGVEGGGRLEEEDVDLLIGDGAVLDAAAPPDPSELADSADP